MELNMSKEVLFLLLLYMSRELNTLIFYGFFGVLTFKPYLLYTISVW